MLTGMLGVVFAVTLAFSPYAPFFSAQTNASPPLDPQVFVKDAAAPAAVGPQSIAHSAGYRPAALQTDPPDAPLFNADGAPLGIRLGKWLGATGSLEIVPLNANAQNVIVRLAGLSPYGAYSLFVNRYDRDATVFAPLDGSGTGNSMIADAGGSASLTVLVSPPLSAASAVVVVFHSDGQLHDMSPGASGVTSHDQLIVRVPTSPR